MVMQLADGSTQPSGATTPGSWIEEDVGAALSTERALLLVYHPFKADSRPFALEAPEASLEEGLSELYHHHYHLGQGVGSSWLMMRCFGSRVTRERCCESFSHQQRSPGA